MILERLDVDAAELAARAGWELKPEGACKGELCVPLDEQQRADARALADRLGMAVVEDVESGLSAVGPESVGRALASAEMPPLALPDLDGRDFELRSLLGTKVFMVAWASW